MRRRFGFAAIAAATACTLIAGCGSSSSGGSTSNESTAAPKTELVDSFRSLAAGSALTTTLSLDTTIANLIHVTGQGGSTPLTQTQAALISGATITIATAAPSGKTLKSAAATSPGSISTKITGSSSGKTYFTFVVADKTLYLQVDLKDLLDAAGKSAEYQSLVARTAALPAFVKAFIAGQFVSLPIATITTLTSILEGAAGGSASQIPSGSQLRTLLNQLQSTLASDVTVARTSSGPTDQLVVTGNVRNIARDFLSTIATAIPALASQITPDSANQAPNRDVKLDASVTSGAISRLEFDFGQFSPHQKDTLPIAATFAKNAPDISAPPGAIPISLQDLGTFIGALGSASSSSGSASSSVVVPGPTAQTSTAPSQ
jgi:hypothetical protein